MSIRRQTRVSSHASLPEHKSEAGSNERSTRSRTSSENLVVLELPKIVRPKRPSHQRSGVEVHDPIKNGKGSSVTPNSEGAASKRGLRNTEHSNNKDVADAVEQHGGGDTKVLGRSRRRSGRVATTPDELEKFPAVPVLQQDIQKEGRSLRRRTRSGPATDHVGNGPAGKPQDNESDNLQADPRDNETRDVHKTSTNEARTEDSNVVDASKGITDASSSNLEPEELQESTSVQKEPDPLNSLQKRSGETDLRIEAVSITSSGMDGLSEQPQKGKEKISSLDLTSTSSEGSLSRTSPRRARQVHPQPAELKDILPNDKREILEPGATDSHLLASNGVKGGKTTPRKRTRISSTSISPRKPSESQEAAPVIPGSPKRRRTGSVCRDLSQDFNTAQPSGMEVTLSPDSQTECNNEIMVDSQDSTLNLERIPEATISDGIDKESLNIIPSMSQGTATGSSAIETAFAEAVIPQRSRHRSGTSPRDTLQKQAQLDLAKSPTRMGLRSSGTITELPSDVTQTFVAIDNDSVKEKIEVMPSISPVVSPRKSSSKKKGSSKKDVVLGKGDAKESGKGREEPGEEMHFSREDVDYKAEEWFEDVDETEPFYFESDHMAIKGNKDYRMLLRTLTTLEAQRKQAIQDLDRLLECREKVLKNPIKFVHKLQHKEALNLPHSQRVVTCPDIDWERYIGPAETNELLGLVSQPRSMRPSKSASTSAHTQAGCGSCSTSQIKPVPMAPPATPALPSAAGVPVSLDPDMPSTSSTPDIVPSADSVELKQDPKVDFVRGRPAEGNKPITFNQLWTRDEQRRLEDYLVKFPTEDVEARRWEKIAKALGNRTSQQVASRVQKYFIKLMKAGMPVPGRPPNLTTYQSYRKSTKRMHAFTKPLYQPSTFLQSIQPPVYMDDDDPYSYDFMDDDDDDDELVSDDESIPTDVRDTPEYQELIRLKLMKRKKSRQQGHAGFRCDGCDMEPIIGIRWHCVECPYPVSTDLCQNCVNCNFSSKHHSSSHQIEPVHASYSQSFVDGDYTSFEPSSGDYNYLDPNYNPMQTT